MLSLDEVELAPFYAAPFVDDPTFPTTKQLEASRQINGSLREISQLLAISLENNPAAWLYMYVHVLYKNKNKNIRILAQQQYSCERESHFFKF